MLTVDVIAREALDPATAHAAEVGLIAAVGGRRRPAVLQVATLAGEVVGLGRYHPAPESAPDSGRLYRRIGGGRVVPLGDGFVSISLILPHRSALVSADPRALRPEQALNRAVRGLLAALRGLGVDAVYPGRDRLTVDRRLLGVVSLQAEPDGTSVFEASLSIDGDWTVLPDWIAAVDPDGQIAAEAHRPEQVTTLARHAARVPTPREIAHLVAAAYASEFGIRPVAAAPADTIDGAAHSAWLAERRPGPGLTRHALAWGQLGAFEAWVGIDPLGAIAEVMLSGDFIADAPSLARLEDRLRGCQPRVEAIEPIVRAVYADPDSFLLGLGSLDLVAETIARAV